MSTIGVYAIEIGVPLLFVSAALLSINRHTKATPAGEEPVLAQLLRHHPALIALTDTNGVIQDTSKAFRRTFAGDRAAGSDHRSIEDVLAERSIHDYHSILHYVMREHKPLFDFHVVAVAEGAELPLEMTVLPVMDGTHAPHSLIHYFDLLPADGGAAGRGDDEDNSGIGLIAAGIAHELNTPLGSIILSADIIQDADIPQPLLEEAAKIKQQAEHCSDVVRGVLLFAKRERQDRQKHDIVGLVKTVCGHIENEARARGSILRVDTPRRSAMVMCNEGQIQQVCYNLLSNALYATNPGGEIKVTVRRESSRREVAVGVEDNGKGIARDDLGRIFDPFFTTKPVSDGTGLGLALCRKTVSEHGGRLEVTSEVGVGSTFTAYFPEAK